MRISTSLPIVAIVLFLGMSPDPADGRPILIDESHDQQTPLSSDAFFSEARTALTGAGHTLTGLPGSPGTITAAALAGYEVFYTGTLNASLFSGEIQALQDFVNAGGGVIVGHNGGWFANAATASVNTFLTPYGVQMAATATYSSGVVATDFVAHCLTGGVQNIGLDYVRLISDLALPAENMTTGSLDVLSVTGAGTGWVIVLGDDSLWTDSDSASDYNITDLDNLALLLNMFGYVACDPSSVDAASWGQVKALYR